MALSKLINVSVIVNKIAFFSSSAVSSSKQDECQHDIQKYISTFTHLNNVLPVAGKQANASGSVRNRRNSIREIHGPVQRPLSEIDGLRRRLRRGQFPWYSVLSPSCCHSCLGSVTPGGGDRKGRPKAPPHPGPRGGPGLPQ